ncbi:Hypothetical predicted protein, partial [Pelobates cultripes]
CCHGNHCVLVFRNTELAWCPVFVEMTYDDVMAVDIPEFLQALGLPPIEIEDWTGLSGISLAQEFQNPKWQTKTKTKNKKIAEGLIAL